MNCPRHPKIETNLRCGKCDQLICPKCAVQTLVGARCPDCAKLTKSPVFRVSMLDCLKAAGVGLALAIALGVGWGIAAQFLLGFSYLIALPAGYLIGDLTNRSVNRKRGVPLQIIAGSSMGICYAIAVILSLTPGLFSLLALIAGIFLATSQFR